MRALLAWEFGSNWGHLATLLPLAQSLRIRGHEVFFAVRGLDGDLSLLTSAGFTYLPMPIAIAPLQQMHRIPVRGYADVLARGGFSDAKTLTQLTLAWNGILHCISPDVVICKYAPLAEFATRAQPVLSIGMGFEVPPLLTPLPSYGSLFEEDRRRLTDVEETILGAINAQKIWPNLKSFESVSAAFAHCKRVLLTWPELDHFGARANGEYLGGAEDLSAFTTIDLVVQSFVSSRAAPATFGYLRLGARWLQAFVDTIQQKKISKPFIIVDPTLTRADCEALSREKCLVMNQPINLIPLMMHCDTLMCHTGHGTISMALSHGKKLLMLPQYMEQIILAQRAIASQPGDSGVALMIEPHEPTKVVEVLAALSKMSPPKDLVMLCDDPIEELVLRVEAMASGHRGHTAS